MHLLSLLHQWHFSLPVRKKDLLVEFACKFAMLLFGRPADHNNIRKIAERFGFVFLLWRLNDPVLFPAEWYWQFWFFPPVRDSFRPVPAPKLLLQMPLFLPKDWPCCLPAL